MPTEWATVKAEGIVLAMLGYLHWNDVRALAAALDAAREQGEREERERWRGRIKAEAEREEAAAQRSIATDYRPGMYAHEGAASVLRSLLSAPAEVAGRKEG